jgi:transcriptional regulator with XRE-family HTH domain
MAKRRSSPADLLVGKRIRMLRVERHLSQQKLAEAIGVTFQQVQKYESGTNRIATGRLLKIAEMFRLPVEAILSGLSADVTVGTTAQFVLTIFEARLLKAYRASNSEQRQLILHTAEQFAKTQWITHANKVANHDTRTL